MEFFQLSEARGALPALRLPLGGAGDGSDDGDAGASGRASEDTRRGMDQRSIDFALLARGVGLLFRPALLLQAGDIKGCVLGRRLR